MLLLMRRFFFPSDADLTLVVVPFVLFLCYSNSEATCKYRSVSDLFVKLAFHRVKGFVQ